MKQLSLRKKAKFVVNLMVEKDIVPVHGQLSTYNMEAGSTNI